MNRPLPLRRRFTLLATLLGLLLSALAACSVALVAEDYEYIIATEVLRGQAEDYGLRLSNGLQAELPRTQRLSGYRIDDPRMPPAYARFPPGVREDPANEDIHVGVFDTSAGRLVFTIDLGDIETLERHLHLMVAGTILLGTLLAGWLGWWLSGIAIRPLRDFAAAVEGLPVQPQPTRLAQAGLRDELGQLAAAIDGYQARLVEADAREQAFLADASHELRTPLAVVRGVADVMLDDPPSAPAAQARLQRLDRGVREMTHLLEAMLATARRRPLHAEPVDAGDLLREAVEIALAGKPGIAADMAVAGMLQVPRREALLLLAGLARMLAQPYLAGRLQVRGDATGLELHVLADATASAPATDPGRADTTTGSALLDRLALRLGWTVAFRPDGSIRVDVGPAG